MTKLFILSPDIGLFESVGRAGGQAGTVMQTGGHRNNRRSVGQAGRRAGRHLVGKMVLDVTINIWSMM